VDPVQYNNLVIHVYMIHIHNRLYAVVVQVTQVLDVLNVQLLIMVHQLNLMVNVNHVHVIIILMLMILIHVIVERVYVLNVYTIQVVLIAKHVEQVFMVMHLDQINVFHVIVVLVV
jgi:hypothetical protein